MRDLIVENITGEINIESHNSDISAHNISGFVNASTYNGDVKITFNNIPNSKDMARILSHLHHPYPK